MILSPKFKQQVNAQGELVLTRKGMAKQVILPSAVKDRLTYDANIVGTDIVFSAGDSVYIISEEIGILHNSGYLETNLFFIDGGMVIELIEGKILLKGENGVLYTIDETGEIGYPSNRTKSYFVSYKDVYFNAHRLTKITYSIPDEEDVNRYVDNLVLNTTFTYESTVGDPVFTTRVIGYYEDLGLNAFQFFNYQELAMFDNDDGDIDELDEDDDEDEEIDDYEYKMDGEDDEEYEDDF